jgi:hypothetical protein
MREIFIDGTTEYQYELIDKTHTLYYNQGEQWQDSVKGTVAMSIVDTGNALKIGGQQTKNNNLSYMESLHLTILLKLINSDYKFEIGEKIEF